MQALILSIAKTVGVNASLLLAICSTETGLQNIDSFNDGNTHSIGVCQVKEDTANLVGKVYGVKDLQKASEEDLRDPKKIIKAAAYYLKWQIERYEGSECIAALAYNSGSIILNKNKKPINLKYLKSVSAIYENDTGQEIECKEPWHEKKLNKDLKYLYRQYNIKESQFDNMGFFK